MNKAAKRYRMISWVAAQYGIHPQTLRLYEREGLLQPTRSAGNTRLYDETACHRLELILTLTRDLGVNLAGVEVILNMKDQIDTLTAELERAAAVMEHEMARREQVPKYNALVLRPRGGLVRAEDE